MPEFYDGQTDYIRKLNEMAEAFAAGPYAALPLTGGTLSGPLHLDVPLEMASGGTGAASAPEAAENLGVPVNAAVEGAVGDGTTDASGAVNAAKQKSGNVRIAEGAYLLESATPTGLYGPGELKIAGQRWRLPLTARRQDMLQTVMAKIVQVSRGNGAVVLVDDSIGEGYYATNLANTWFNMLQKMMALYSTSAPFGEPEVTNMLDPSRYGLVYSGSFDAGTAGPIERSVILQPGSSLSFTGAYNFTDPVFEQKPGGGVLTLAKNGSTFREIDTNGSLTHDRCYFPSSGGPPSPTDVYTFTASGGPVEITGLWRLAEVASAVPTIFAARMARSGSSTRLHSKDACIESVIRHARSLNPAAKPLIFVGLGINNTNSDPTIGTTPALYQQQLEKMFAKYLNAGAYVVARGLICPDDNWPSNLAVYGEYAAAQSRACEIYGVPLFEMDGAHWVEEGMFHDGLHPNDKGNTYMLDTVLNKMSAPSFDPGANSRENSLQSYSPLLSWYTTGLQAATVVAGTARFARKGPFCKVIVQLEDLQPTANAGAVLGISLPHPSSSSVRSSGNVSFAKGLTTTGSAWSVQNLAAGSSIAVIRSLSPTAEDGYAEVTAVSAGARLEFELEYITQD